MENYSAQELLEKKVNIINPAIQALPMLIRFQELKKDFETQLEQPKV